MWKTLSFWKCCGRRQKRNLGAAERNCPGFWAAFLPVWFHGCRHIGCILNFLQTRTEAGFRRTYSEDWTPQLGMCHRCTQGPASSPSPALCPLPALHLSRSRWHTLLWGHNLLFASGSPEVEVSVLSCFHARAPWEDHLVWLPEEEC